MKMPPPFPHVPGSLKRTVLSLLILTMGLLQCGGEHLILLDIDAASIPATANRLLLRTSLNHAPMVEMPFSLELLGLDMGRRGISVHLPASARGTLQIELFGLDVGGCKVAQKSLMQDVPGGLNNSTRRDVTLEPFFDQTCWVRVPPQSGLNLSTINLYAVTAFDAASVIAVGDKSTILNCRADVCNKIDVPELTLMEKPPTLKSVWVDTTKKIIYAAGDNGTVVQCMDTLPCKVLPSGSMQPLFSIWGSSANNVYAVGGNEYDGVGGTIVRCTDHSCTTMSISSPNKLKAVWGSGPDNVYAVGISGRVWRCSGQGNCDMLTIPIELKERHFNAVWGSDAKNVYVAGFNGSLLHCEEKAPNCTTLLPSSSVGNNAIWGSDASNVYVVGVDSTVSRCQSGLPSCSGLNTPPGPPRVVPPSLNAVWGGDASHFYAVGIEGRMLICDAASDQCTALESGTKEDLNAVSGTDVKNVYAVGNNGVVLRYSP